MFPQLSNAASYPVKDFSSNTTSASKSGFIKRISLRKENKVEAAGEVKMTKQTNNSINKAPIYQGGFYGIRASPAKFY